MYWHTVSQHSDLKTSFITVSVRHPSDRHWKVKLAASFPLVTRPFTRGRLETQLLCYCCFNVGGKWSSVVIAFLYLASHTTTTTTTTTEKEDHSRDRSEVTYSVTLTGRTPTEWAFPWGTSQTHRTQTSTFQSHTCGLSLSVQYRTSLWFFLITYYLSFSLVEPRFKNVQVTFHPTLKRNDILLKVSGSSF